MRNLGYLILDMVQIFTESNKPPCFQGDKLIHNAVIFISLDKE
jgi:hypothetical protein